MTEGTLKKSRYFFETQLKEWAEAEKLVYLDQLTPALLTKFRAGWTNAAQTVQRKHERLIAFLWFCVRMEWITKNPAILLKRVKAEQTPTDYFPREEFKVLVDATYAYGDWRGGHDFEHRRDRLRALILLMRWSGLAILDAVDVGADAPERRWKPLPLPRQNRRAGLCAAPARVHTLLRSLPNSNAHYFFWSGNGDP